MKIIDVEQNTDQWLDLRRGKITGSKLNDIIVHRGTGEKIGFYELIAERLGVDDQSEDGRERGHELEGECVDAIAKELGVEVVKGGFWVHDQYPDIAVSPDGAVKNAEGKFTIAIDSKCLSGARHIEAWHTKELDKDYYYQGLQHFIVNEDLETMYFAFYDPRIPFIKLHWIKIERAEVAEDIQKYLEYQVATLAKVNDIVEKLSF